ncbi:MAG: helix-turn-helix transcriptional regulator [Candidatus Bathyarchaeota archaeon]|nr:MAG: helix-turn-helix transcriptional regulator [Candidatus Bathyarchaeota archaeon]
MVAYVSDSFKKEIVQRMFRNFLDIMILNIVQDEPTWGYQIIKHVEEKYDIRLRHGALYPLLNNLERKQLLKRRKEAKGGRVRKVYEITSKGIQVVIAFNEFLQDYLQEQNTKTGI